MQIISTYDHNRQEQSVKQANQQNRQTNFYQVPAAHQ